MTCFRWRPRPVGALLLALACAPGEPGAVLSLVPLESPAGPLSGEPNLAVDGAGRVYLSWLERSGDSTFALRYAVRGDGGWSVPTTLVERSDLFVNWADFPSLFVSPSGHIAAHWLQRGPGGRYSYNIFVRQSRDGGTTWTGPRQLNTDATAAEHGFLSFIGAGGDSIEAVWLDGRLAGQGEGKAMQLANATLATDGGVSDNIMLDTRICDCCQTSAARTSNGPVVVYRDRSPDEVRDIAIVRHVDGRWTSPARVHADDWAIDGCPVNGPAIAASGEHVAVAWFTGARDTARVNVSFSRDAGATFGLPVRVDDGRPAGRVDVELDGAGRAIVTWLERTTGDGAEVRLRSVDERGARSRSSVVAMSSAARASGFPRMARAGASVVIAWTLPGDSARVQLATGILANP